MFVRIGKNKIKITKSSDAYFLVSKILKGRQPIDREKEFLICIGLKVSNEVKYVDIVSIGTLTGTLACGREIYKAAVIKSANAIILCHNHPSENRNPSKADIDLTEKMVQAGNFLGIPLMDHIIVTTNCGYYSFADEGLIKTSEKDSENTT